MPHYRAIAAYYDAENEQHAMLERDLPFFLGHLPSRKRLRVLDVACGTGRSSIPIAQAGHRVVGVDYAQDMLDIAVRKRDSVGIKERDLSFTRQDALKLDLTRRERPFDWACIFFNTFLNFTTLAQQDRLLSRIRAHLKPRGGRLWIDIFHPDPQRLSGPKRTKIDPSMFHVPSLERTVYRDVDIRPEPAKQLQHVTFNYRWFDGDGREKRTKVEFSLTWIVPRELEILLERNGFKLEALYGDYDGSTLKDESPRMIAMAARTKD